MRRPADGTLVLAGGLLLALAIGPLVLRGDQAESQRLAENRRQIAEMTEAERARLERNYEQYLAMSPAERERWGAFNQRLELDRSRDQGRLTAVMDDYYRWLQSVPGYRREELRQAAKLEDKLAVVEKVVGDQLAERLESPEVETRQGEGFRIKVLNAAALAQAMSAIEDFLQIDAESLVDDQGAPLAGLERYLQVTRALQTRYQSVQPLLVNQRFLNAVRNALPEGALEETEEPAGPRMRMQVISTLFFSLQDELIREWRKLDPSPAELQAFFEQNVPPEQQEDLYNLSAHEFVEQVRRRYIESKLSERLGLDVREVLGFFNPRPVLMQFRGNDGRGGPERDGERFRLRPDRGGFFPGPGGFDRPPPREDREPPPRDGDPPRDRPPEPPPERRPDQF